jgi:hypothetical protein
MLALHFRLDVKVQLDLVAVGVLDISLFRWICVRTRSASDPARTLVRPHLAESGAVRFGADA